MFISGVGEIDAEQGVPEDPHEEFRTANELFELMTSNCGFEVKDGEALTTQDLVLLYQNIDIGTKLMNSANEVRRPNQYVETIVYNDDLDSDTDISDDVLPDIFKINQERLNFFSNSSLENVLCQKLGDLEIQMSGLSSQYERQFFKKHFAKDQLQNIFDIDLKTVLPTSLLDFICFKRLDDNYNIYMDNIINYVQRTIEQLKRISNGDYLTDRTKEKWREVTAKCTQDISTLSNACIPLHKGRKKGIDTNWHDMVHSAIDVRSLSKMIKKKIVIEIPKLISGSFRVFGKRDADNLVISCKREKKIQKKDNDSDSQLDVVLQVKQSATGQITTRVSSIMILRMPPEIPTKEPRAPEILPLPCNPEILPLPSNLEMLPLPSNPEMLPLSSNPEILPLTHKQEETDSEALPTISNTPEDSCEGTSDPIVIPGEVDLEEAFNEGTTCTDSDCFGFYDVNSNELSSASSNGYKGTTENPVSSLSITSNEELRMTIQRLNMQTVLPEESTEDITRPNRKKSPVRRVKSPYENKLFLMEEKKRRKLLEIRERREKRKQALSENSKETKNKGGKINAAQPSSSVTKLSITNKSFYNSIYGRNFNVDKLNKGKNRKGNKKENSLALDVSIEGIKYIDGSRNVTPERYGKQYIDRSYYLDEAETEVEQNENINKQTYSASTSTTNNNDFHTNIDLLHQFIGSSLNNLDEAQFLSSQDDTHNNTEIIDTSEVTELLQAPNKRSNVKDTIEPYLPPSTLECRKSIERLYSLIRNSKKPDKVDLKTSTTKFSFTKPEVTNNCTAQGTSSVTSLRNHFEESPNLSNLEKTDEKKCRPNDKTGPPAPVIPKVIINSKQAIKHDPDNIKKDRRKFYHPVVTKVMPENPLKAISQLLQEFDHVQKTRQRFAPDNKGLKKVETATNEGRNINRQFRDVNIRTRSRFDQHARDIEQNKTTPFPHREKRKPVPPADVQKSIHQRFEEKAVERNNIVNKKIIDIIEEVKEARGEAIRGPPKSHSRLHTLAQPKKAYLQAHSEDYQSKYGRNLMANRLQRLAAATKSEKGVANSRLKTRRNAEALPNDESTNTVFTPPQLQNTEKSVKPNQISAIPHRSSPRNSPKISSRGLTINRGNHMESPPRSPARNVRSPARTSQFSPHSSPRPQISPNRKLTPENCMGSIPESTEVSSKMAAVESYVKNHYGLRSQSPKSTKSLQPGHKSRVPLVPKEMTVLTSSPNAGDANELGSALHSIITSMIDTNSTQYADCEVGHDDHFSMSGIHTDSDFNVVSEDPDNKAIEASKSHKCQLKSLSSKTELEKLESALYNQMSGAFQKRLRIKNLTLTPKQSMQNVYLLQSGDAGSLLVKSLTKIKINECDENGEIKRLPVMLNNSFEFDFMQIPPQQQTVGYTFALHNMTEKKKASHRITSVINRISSQTSNDNFNIMSDKIIQCFKVIPDNPRQKNEVRVVVENEIPNMTRSITLNFNKTDAVLGQCMPNTGTSQGLIGTDQIFLPKKDKSRKEKTTKNKNVKDTVTKDNNSLNDATVKDNVKKIDSEDNYIVKKFDVISMVETSVADRVETLDKNLKCAVAEKSTNAEFTSSLDVLVGLLDEIQKITNQTHLRDSNTDLNTKLTNAASKENLVLSPIEPRVVSSLERLKKLDPKPSIYSLYISAKDCMKSSSYDFNIGMNSSVYIDKDVDVDIENSRTFPITINHSTNVTNSLIGVNSVYIDKEVDVDIEKKMVTAFTEASRTFPFTINHSTNVTNSLIGIISQPSNQSMYFFNDCHSLCSRKISNSQSVENFTGISSKEVKEAVKASKDRNSKISMKYDIATVVPVNHDISKFKVNKFIENYKEFDPLLKMKRDILVTMYSLLVFIVFAALSFPELMLTNM